MRSVPTEMIVSRSVATQAGGMSRKAGLVAALGLVALVVTGCADQGAKQNMGTLLGAGAGAVAGSQFGSGKGRLVGVAAGTLLGALAGSSIGKSLDRADQQHLASANQRAFETARSGTAVTWRNPDSGNYGTVVPQQAYQASGGQYCREFQQTINVGGETQQGYGTACRQPDGSWKIVQQ